MALTMLFDAYLSPRLPIVGLVGSGCEAATIPTAKISQFYGLTQVRWHATAHMCFQKPIGYSTYKFQTFTE